MHEKLAALKGKASSVAHHVHENRGRYSAGATFVATAGTAVVLGKVRADQWNTFLEKHALLDEFYSTAEQITVV